MRLKCMTMSYHLNEKGMRTAAAYLCHVNYKRQCSPVSPPKDKVRLLHRLIIHYINVGQCVHKRPGRCQKCRLSYAGKRLSHNAFRLKVKRTILGSQDIRGM